MEWKKMLIQMSMAFEMPVYKTVSFIMDNGSTSPLELATSIEGKGKKSPSVF